MEIHEYLSLDMDTGTISCNECGHEIADTSQNYKKHCAMSVESLSDIGPAFGSPDKLLRDDHEVQFRRFFCPECAVLIDHEIARVEDPILQDIEIDLDAL